MKKYKKSLTIIISIFVVLLFIIIALLKVRQDEVKKNQSDNNSNNTIKQNYTIENEKENDIANNNARTEYYVISKIITDYYNSVFNILNIKPNLSMGGIAEDDLITIKQNYENQLSNIYDSLSDEYINSNNITISNIEEKMEEKNMATVRIASVKKIKESGNIKIFYVLTDLKDVQTSQISEKGHLLYLDEKNNTYAITLDSFIKQRYGNVTENTNINIPQEIIKKQNNEYLIRQISDDEYVKDLLSDLTYNLIYKKNNAYNILDEQYKNNKFKNIDEFYRFISNNEEVYKYLYRNLTGDTTGLNTMEELESYRINKFKYGISKYEVKDYGNYKQYVIKDKQNRYFIINESNPMEYKALLDSYTCETEIMTDMTEKMNEDNKCEHYLNQYIEMINLKDYGVAYDKLEDRLKQNIIISNFENYIKERFFDSNYIESVKKISTNNGLNTYEITLKENEYGNETKIVRIGITIKNKDFKVVFD